MSFLDTLLGNDAADAANAAAQDTYAKQLAAIKELKTFGNQYADQFRNLSTRFDPYVNTGTGAQNAIADLMGFNGPQAQQQARANFQTDPGYQFAFGEGQRAIDSSAAARGMSNSGATLKALQRYGTGIADQQYGNYLQRLMSLGQQGQSATGSQVNTIGTGLQGQLGTRTTAFGGQMNASPTIGQGMVAGANAEAAGAGNIMKLVGSLAGSAFASPWVGNALGFGGGGGLGSSFFGKGGA